MQKQPQYIIVTGGTTEDLVKAVNQKLEDVVLEPSTGQQETYKIVGQPYIHGGCISQAMAVRWAVAHQ